MPTPKVKKDAKSQRNKVPKTTASELVNEDGSVTPLGYMFKRMNDPNEPHSRRAKLAKELAPYFHAKLRRARARPEPGPIHKAAVAYMRQVRLKIFRDF